MHRGGAVSRWVLGGAPGGKGSWRRAAVQIYAAALVIVLVVGGAVAAYVFYAGRTTEGCNAQILTQIGAENSGLCLRPLNIVVSGSNSSEFYVPVLAIAPGSTGTIEILYHISAGVYVSRPQEKPQVNSTDVPIVLSIATGRPAATGVYFSDGVQVFGNADWTVYSYRVTASAGAAGYYAILPKYYAGVYPALAVGPGAGNLNTSALATWGYTGLTVSGEVIVPSTIVGTSGIDVLNVTIPATTNCPTAACVFMSHSFY